MSSGDPDATLDESYLFAQSLKIAILRLESCLDDEAPCLLHDDDLDFGEPMLVLLLGRLNNEHSRQAFVDLFDFQFGDAVYGAIGQVVDEHRKDLIPVMRQRIGQPLCKEAMRANCYVTPMPKANRDRQLSNWISDIEAED